MRYGKRYTDEQALEKITAVKALLPGLEVENPTKDFSRLRYFFDLIEHAILAKDRSAETAALLEYEQEWFHLFPGFTQKYLDC